MDEIRFDEKWPRSTDLPASAIRAVLCITQAAGLVRLTRHGFSITEVGREVHRRIEPETRTRMPQFAPLALSQEVGDALKRHFRPIDPCSGSFAKARTPAHQ